MNRFAIVAAGTTFAAIVFLAAIVGAVSGLAAPSSAACGTSATGAVDAPKGKYNAQMIATLWTQSGGSTASTNITGVGNVPNPVIAGAVGMAESGGDPKIVNGIGASGLMQIHPPEPGVLDPATNMKIAIRKFKAGGWQPWEAFTGKDGAGDDGPFRTYLKKVKTPASALVDPACDTTAIGPANLNQAVQLSSPRQFATLPGWAMAGGRSPAQVDARILPDVEWALRRYNLRLTAGRETGHHTHGDGTAVDLVPAHGNTQAAWDASAKALARDLGWTPGCASSGVAPTCPLKPAIRGIFYNGFPGHGDPAHVGGNAHLHLSWYASHYGASGLAPPNDWVRVFPVPGTGGTAT